MMFTNHSKINNSMCTKCTIALLLWLPRDIVRQIAAHCWIIFSSVKWFKGAARKYARCMIHRMQLWIDDLRLACFFFHLFTANNCWAHINSWAVVLRFAKLKHLINVLHICSFYSLGECLSFFFFLFCATPSHFQLQQCAVWSSNSKK